MEKINYDDPNEKQKDPNDQSSGSKWAMFSKLLFSDKIKFNDENINKAKSEILEREK
jgi:hypothetical protein